MTMHAATVLRFVKFPRVSNRPQQSVDGRAWQIVKIEAPFCWARPHGSGGPHRQYLVQEEQRSGPPHGRPRQPGRRRSQSRRRYPHRCRHRASETISGSFESLAARPLSLISVGVRLHRAFSLRRIELSRCRAAARWAASSVLRNRPRACAKRAGVRVNGHTRATVRSD
jgi:hypothetical protein